jgi:hypothetical protein
MVRNFEALVVLHEGDIAAVKHDPGFGQILLNTARATVLVTARDLAPVRKDGPSHGGRQSIQAVLGEEDGEYTVRVGWDEAHSYMRFPNMGDRFIKGRHFLEAAARQWSTGDW